jgi:rhodanese-related sulfurtransferase
MTPAVRKDGGGLQQTDRQIESSMMKSPLAAIVFLSFLAVVPAQAEEHVPASKRTSIGLYVTASEAYSRWKADPENTKIIDVRTPEEYVYVGHPAMAWNVPLKLMTYRWDAAKSKPLMRLNQDFIAGIRKIVLPTDTILVTCRSGNRSTPAVNLLTEAGFRNVFNVVDGFEGDKEKDETSPNFGKRTVNGWKIAGLPWTYKLDPKLMWLENGR